MSSDEMREIVERNEAMCSASVGAFKALEYAVRILIATHPNPGLVNHTWQDLLSEIPDHNLDTSVPNPDMFHATLSAMLATLTQQIELAARS